MFYGVQVLPEGRRRLQLQQAVAAIFATDMAGRVLWFDEAAADAYAEIAALRRGMGRPMGLLDAMIAGIARSRGADLATRNISDFEACGLRLINPWS
jgi:predicted nucleic acid-binding protein